MWTFVQVSGRMINAADATVGVGYSGRQPDGKNQPGMQAVQNVGPIPQGLYRIGTPIDTMTHGPFVLPLSPNPNNVMFGRSGFLIHGDSVVYPGTASEGCIVMARDVREAIANSGDFVLTVVSGVAPALDPEIAT